MGALKKIIYNCKQATFLIEKRLAGKITFRESVELRIHLAGCSVCKLYDQQTRKINEMVRQLFHSSMHSAAHLDEKFKKELQERIEEEMNKN